MSGENEVLVTRGEGQGGENEGLGEGEGLHEGVNG